MNHRVLLAAVACVLALPVAAQRGARPVAPPRTATLNLAPDLSASRTSVSFGAVAAGASAQEVVQLVNTGVADAHLSALRLELAGAGNGVAWSVELDGMDYAGGAATVSHALDVDVARGTPLPMTITFAPTSAQYDALTLVLLGEFDGDLELDKLTIALSGLGGHQGDPYLHVVVEAPDFVVDYDADGSEAVTLDGSASHTHEPGRTLAGYEWRAGGVPFSTDPITTPTLALGTHAIELEISDDDTPPKTLVDSVEVDVVAASVVPGVLALYYDAGAASPAPLLFAVPPNADFGERVGDTAIPSGATIGSSGLTQNVMVRLIADVLLPTDGTYEFVPSGGVDRLVRVDGAPAPGPVFLTAGVHALEARFAVEGTSQLPLAIHLSFEGGAPALPDPADLTHDESALVPVLNDMPDAGTNAGGNQIELVGLGFFPAAAVTVNWGSTTLTQADFTVLTPERIEFLSPAGAGTISVSVTTPQGTSNARTYAYSPTGPVPVKFDIALSIPLTEPTAAVWGPDRRLYVIANTGELTAFGFDDTYSAVTSQVTYPGVSGLTNHNALGLTVNPHDPPSPVRLYVGHGEHFLNGGSTFTGPSAYTGQVSVLAGPDFDSPVPLITGLPTSNHDHAVNGLVFDHNGDLYVAVGSNTNAGVRHPNSGDLPESPLSAAVLKAETSKPGFVGAVTYTHSTTGQPSADQVEGEHVDVDPGVDVDVHAAGVRNPFGVVYTTRKRLYLTDNGPNAGFGAASTGPASETSDPTDEDELILVEHGVYYGHPNRNRGRTQPRQNVYYGGLSNGPPSMPGRFRREVQWLPSSSDGIVEYRAETFNGALRGWLLVQEFLGDLLAVELSADGRNVTTRRTYTSPFTGALGLVTLPGGALGALDYSGNRVLVLTPDDPSAVGLVVHDVFPWRVPADGGTPFTIAGVGFGDLGDTGVTIGGRAATLTRVSATRIEGWTPVDPEPTQDLQDVAVTVGGTTKTLAQAVRTLNGPGQEKGDWESLPVLPIPMGEVACGVVGGQLIVVGETGAATLAYDLVAGTWSSSRAVRPYVGHHHAAEVLNGKLFLFGGLDGGSEGKVQIYDPVADLWTTGADMPWAGGSLSTCVIGTKVYVAGGIVGSFTVNNCAVYDPQLDTWTTRAAMPDGRNHAASASDGSRFWIFGGRKGGNFVSNGFDQVFVYDPQTNSWESSDDVGSTLVPLPQFRGGMGKAVWYQDEFYVFGGETATGPGATPDDVYDRVDVYDPATDTWRAETPMPSPRHGIFPLLFEGRIFVAGGGLAAGFAQSTVFDAFSRQ